MRYRNINSGAIVDVRDDKPMGSEWEPAEQKTAPKKKTAGAADK